MKKPENNFAYVDGANLHKGIAELGWRLDYRKFRVWLLEKYGVSKAYRQCPICMKNFLIKPYWLPETAILLVL